jgi:hypothetical protein
MNAPRDWPERKKTEPLNIRAARRGANLPWMNAPREGWPTKKNRPLKIPAAGAAQVRPG